MFSADLKAGTKKSHSAAENTKFVGAFLRGVVDEEEYKKLLVLVFHFWRFFLLFFGITPFLVLLLMK